MTDTCVLYIAWGNHFYKKALLSSKSFKRLHPDIEVNIITDVEDEDEEFDNVKGLQEQGERHTTKVYNLANFVEYASHYKNILYLDSDTYVCGDLSGLFELSQIFDLALAHAPMRRIHKEKRRRHVSDAFADFNSGVMMIRRSPEIVEFLRHWYIDSLTYPADQIALCELLYFVSPNISVHTLTPEYNARVGFPGYYQGEVKIIHAQGLDLENVAKDINKSKGMRLWNK